MPNITRVTSSPKSWKIKYQYWLGNKIDVKRVNRTIIVNSQFQPTRTAALDYARADLLSNAVLGHGHGQYGYTRIEINFIGRHKLAVRMDTKQPLGTDAAVTETTYQRSGNPFV